MRRASCLVSPIPDHAFFEQSQFEGLLGDNFLEVLRFAPKLLDLVGRRCTSGVSGKPALAGLEELLRPRVIHALGNAFAPAKLGDRGFAAIHRAQCGSSLPPHGASELRVGCRGQRLPTTRAWTWISVSSSLLGGYDEPEILRSSSC